MEFNEIKEIKTYITENELLIYPTQDVPDDFPNISWDGDDWKMFIKTAIKQNVSMIFLKEELFRETHISSNIIPTSDSDERIIEFNNKIRAFDDHIGELAIFVMYWIKNDTIFSFTKTAKWANEFLNISVMLENTEDREVLGM